MYSYTRTHERLVTSNVYEDEFEAPIVGVIITEGLAPPELIPKAVFNAAKVVTPVPPRVRGKVPEVISLVEWL